MKDPHGVILYVGKAKSLKSRVSSYFQDNRGHTPRVQVLVKKIADFEVVLTDSESEALVLECNLIKKHKPRYNVMLKDDKSYPYVRLDVNHPFPRLEYTRKVRKDGARYFGPYVSGGSLREMLTWARKEFQLRDCSDNEFRNRSRPCLLHQMGQCSAPCVGFIKGEQYGHALETVLKILEGKPEQVIRELKVEMARASAGEDYERAATLRDRIQHIEEAVENQGQKVLDPESDLARDVVQLARSGSQAVVVVMAVRGGRAEGVFQYPFKDVDPDQPDAEFLAEFLGQYYVRLWENPAPVGLPEEVLVPASTDGARAELEVITRALGKRVDFRVPKRGEAAHLLEMVKKTVDHALEELTRNVMQSESDLTHLQEKLSLTRYPRRIECYDISHFQGEGTVASRVVFIDGKPEKTLYRHYHVTEVEGPDDFKSMLEVLRRRFSKDEGGLAPDLVVIDGGRGQLKQAEVVFEELGVINVDLVALAKARSEKGTMERVFKPGQKNPIALKPGTGAHRVMTQARDEAHRFAITFHRKVRDQRILDGR